MAYIPFGSGSKHGQVDDLLGIVQNCRTQKLHKFFYNCRSCNKDDFFIGSGSISDADNFLEMQFPESWLRRWGLFRHLNSLHNIIVFSRRLLLYKWFGVVPKWWSFNAAAVASEAAAEAGGR